MKSHPLFLTAALAICLLAGCGRRATPPDTRAATWWKDLPEHRTLKLPLGRILRLRLIQPGRFTMGSPPDEQGRDDDEGPRRVVTLSQPYYIGVTEITQAQYQAVMGNHPSRFRSPDRPVDSVTWREARSFCRRVSLSTGQTVQLPTEAQWERAARAGSDARFCFGDDETLLPLFAVFRRTESAVVSSRSDPNDPDGQTAPVASRKANVWGLHDMHGNVFEWTRDWYADRYDANERLDPTGPSTGPYHVLRGGSFASPAWLARSAYRHRFSADGRYNHLIGFRVVMIPTRSATGSRLPR